jgi:hypothetical protein
MYTYICTSWLKEQVGSTTEGKLNLIVISAIRLFFPTSIDTRPGTKAKQPHFRTKGDMW